MAEIFERQWNTDIPLDLDTKWYTEAGKTPPYVELAIEKGKAVSPGGAETLASSQRGVAILGVRWTPSLSRTYVKVEWTLQNGTPITNSVIQKHARPISALDFTQEQILTAYGPTIVKFCHDRNDQTVGNGECTDLPFAALQAFNGAVLYDTATQNIWGIDIYSKTMGGTTGKLDSIRPGDIAQFTNFRNDDVNDVIPSHTGIITQVLGDARFEMHHQNVGRRRYVVVDTLDLGKVIKSGSVIVYRPIDVNKVGSVNLSYDGDGWGAIAAKWNSVTAGL